MLSMKGEIIMESSKRKNYASLIREVYNIEPVKDLCYAGPLYSNQLYRVTTKTGEDIYGYVTKVSEIISVIDDKPFDYDIKLGVILNIDKDIVEFDNPVVIDLKSIESITKMHPIFEDAIGKPDRRAFKSYSVFQIGIGDSDIEVDSFSIQKIISDKTMIFGYVTGVDTNSVTNRPVLKVDSIRFYHGAVQRKNCTIDLDTVSSITRQQLVIEEYVSQKARQAKPQSQTDESNPQDSSEEKDSSEA